MKLVDGERFLEDIKDMRKFYCDLIESEPEKSEYCKGAIDVLDFIIQFNDIVHLTALDVDTIKYYLSQIEKEISASQED